MGLSGSWIGFPNLAKERLLRELGLEETGETGDFFMVANPFSLGEMPEGALILYSNDFDWADPSRLLDLPRMGLVVGCQFSDTVMASNCSAAQDGQALWHVSHESDKGIYNLEVSGDPPAEFTKIRERCVAEQEEEGGEGANVDILFDAPLLLAKLLCGLKYDDESSELVFMGVRPVDDGWAAMQLLKKRTWRSPWRWVAVVALIALALLALRHR